MIRDLAFHITLSADTETVKLFFSTIGFAVMCWAIVKFFKG